KSVFVTESSAAVPGVAAFTVVVFESVLFAVLLSPDEVVTVAVLVSVPAALAVTTIVMVSLSPDAIVPRSHVSRPAARVQLSIAWDGVAEINVAPAGSVSVTETLFAGLGPALLTCKV